MASRRLPETLPLACRESRGRALELRVREAARGMARQMIVCSRFERHMRVDAPWHVGALELSGRAECDPWPLAWPGRYF